MTRGCARYRYVCQGVLTDPGQVSGGALTWGYDSGQGLQGSVNRPRPECKGGDNTGGDNKGSAHTIVAFVQQKFVFPSHVILVMVRPRLKSRDDSKHPRLAAIPERGCWLRYRYHKDVQFGNPEDVISQA